MSTLPPLSSLTTLPPLGQLAPAPSIDPLAPPVTPIDPGTPILQSLPSAQTAFTRKYTDPNLQSALQSLPPALRNSLIQFDQTRVNRGQQPLSSAQTLAALQTAQSNQAATPPEDSGLFSRAVGDIQSLVSSVPQLPFQLYNEVTQLPDAPGKLSDVLGRGDLQSIIGGLNTVPGLRMVPGINTLSTLANEGPGGLLQHPIFTALDVLPYAHGPIGSLVESSLGKLPSVANAADAVDLTAENAARTTAGLNPLPDPSNLRLFGQTSPTIQALRNSRVGQLGASMFGGTARDLSQLYYSATNDAVMAASDTPPPGVLTPDTQLMHSALVDARQWAQDITPARRTELTNAMQLDRTTALDMTQSDAERAFVQGQIDHTNVMGNFAVRQNWLGQVDGEYLSPQEANRLLNSRAQVGRVQALSDARSLITQASPDTATDVLGQLDTSNIVSEHLKRTDQLTLAKAYAHTVDAAGYDSSPLFDAISTVAKDKSIPIQSLRDMFDVTLANPTPNPIIPPDQIVAQLEPFMGRVSSATTSDPLTAQVRALIQNGDYQSALSKMRQIDSRSTFVIPDSEQMVDSLTRLRDRQKFLDSTSQFNDRTLTRVQKSNTALEARTIPARFVPLVEQSVESKLREMYVGNDDALKLIQQHLYTQLPDLGPAELGKLYRDVAKGWQDLKTQGYDPVFVHRVSPSAIPSVSRPTITDAIRTPTSVKARTLDATPYVHDASVALTDQAMGYLQRLASDEYIKHIQSIYGQSTDQLTQRFLPLAQQAADAQPGLDVSAHLQNLMQRAYVKYDPASIFPTSRGSLGTITGAQDDLWIPKTVNNVLQQMFHDPSPKLTGVFDPIMRTFRTALIPLSPRSFMHHFVGAGVQLAAETSPSIFFRYLSQARDLVNSGEFAGIKGMPPSGFGDAPAEIVDWGKRATKSDQVVAGQQLMAGQWLRKNVFDRLAPVTDAAGNGIDRIYQFRSHMDDMYRAMGYLYGQDKALTAGLSDTEAQSAGIAVVRKTMQSWDRMTPMERQTIRFVFPFYGYMSHVLKYAYNYTMDHPFRVSVLNSFARNEANDFGTALPSQFMDALFLGNPDPKTGTVNTLQLQSLNPFRDVANYFTLAGFTGASNPVISSALKALGVDPRKGAPSLYPDIAYDPVTGQLRPDNPSFLSSFIGNVIPQTQIITALLGANDQFKSILAQNPDAAAASLRSAAGLPNLFRSFNPAQEAFKAELQREQLQSTVKSEALKSGDYSRAQNFPALRAYFQQVSQLMGTNPQVFQPYVAPQSNAPGTNDALLQGVIRNNLP